MGNSQALAYFCCAQCRKLAERPSKVHGRFLVLDRAQNMYNVIRERDGLASMWQCTFSRCYAFDTYRELTNFLFGKWHCQRVIFINSIAIAFVKFTGGQEPTKLIVTLWIVLRPYKSSVSHYQNFTNKCTTVQIDFRFKGPLRRPPPRLTPLARSRMKHCRNTNRMTNTNIRTYRIT